ncbi:MAG: sulfotransferase domain-containing protein, partial [Microcoleaceae cyanobacterium]
VEGITFRKFLPRDMSKTEPRLVVKDKIRDSSIWNRIKPRDNDIVIASCQKSGTTLTQQIVNLLINGHDNFKSIHDVSPWVEKLVDKVDIEHIEQLSEPRVLKTHLPFDALPYYSNWKYIYLGRDPRDIGISLYNQIQKFNQFKLVYDDCKDEVEFPDFWDKWIDTGEPWWSYWENLNSWWQVRYLPNVMLVRYANLINHKPEEIKKIAKFLELEIDDSKLKMILQYSSLKYMRENWPKFEEKSSPQSGFLVNKGTNGRWQNLLSDRQLQSYEKMLSERVEPACADWITNGKQVSINNW